MAEHTSPDVAEAQGSRDSVIVRTSVIGIIANVLLDFEASETGEISRKTLPPYDELFAMFPEADLLLVEGLRGTELPKLEIIKPDDERSPALPEDKVLGYIAENAAFEANVPVFDREDVKGIVDYIMELYESGALKGALV